jgi:hypothetical protein
MGEMIPTSPPFVLAHQFDRSLELFVAALDDATQGAGNEDRRDDADAVVAESRGSAVVRCLAAPPCGEG